ncbi:AraC family transcriptional regulator [Azorhizobium oxalatiphilum]|uniref:AraC family transcriptional regulator n=1 Tax=Azorhizobium oxalatiphilum TaxID=980631 RepID=A0A917BRD4_9HYPH|nr:helix-turn-helix transcriptional regulator [Azorhizobium oxalatiphilum]GGF54115.1 AraC family transcriptional regulator [Azorhizobium oxalatiphilum]
MPLEAQPAADLAGPRDANGFLADMPVPDRPRRVVAFKAENSRGTGKTPHSHRRGQLLSVLSGSIAVSSGEGTYVVPPERALWIPPDVRHDTRHLSMTQLRTVYVERNAALAMPGRMAVVQVSPLLRCLIDAVTDLPPDYDESAADGRLVSVLLDQIAASPVTPLHLPLPASPALRGVADGLLADPADKRTLEAWAAPLNMSARTLERRFKAETGLSLRAFRRQAKLFRALEMVAAREPVSRISDTLGFEGPSAFIAMFRAAFGVTPGRYLSERAGA